MSTYYPEEDNGFRFALCCLLFLIAVLLFGCKSTKPIVTVPEIHNQYNGHDRDHSSARGDSIHIRDSIIYRWKHDTLFVDRWHTEFRDRWRHDTLTLRDSIHVNDSIPYPVEVQVPVRVRNGYDKFTAKGFWILLGILILIVCWKIAKAYFKIQTGGMGSILSKFL